MAVLNNGEATWRADAGGSLRKLLIASLLLNTLHFGLNFMLMSTLPLSIASPLILGIRIFVPHTIGFCGTSTSTLAYSEVRRSIRTFETMLSIGLRLVTVLSTS